RALGPRALARRRRAIARRPPPRRPPTLLRELRARPRAAALALERPRARAPAARRRGARLAPALAGLVVALGGLLRLGLRAPLRRPQRHAGAARLRQADRHRLPARPRAVLALAHVVDL